MSDFFVVIEWNQAGGLPRVADDDVYLSRDEAELLASAMQAELLAAAKQAGVAPRRDRYAVARLEIDDEDW